MATTAKVYLDQNSGFLGYKGDDGNWVPVKVDALFYGSNLYFDKNQLYVKLPDGNDKAILNGTLAFKIASLDDLWTPTENTVWYENNLIKFSVDGSKTIHLSDRSGNPVEFLTSNSLLELNNRIQLLDAKIYENKFNLWNPATFKGQTNDEGEKEPKHDVRIMNNGVLRFTFSGINHTYDVTDIEGEMFKFASRDSIPNMSTTYYPKLYTDTKTIIGAINELATMLNKYNPEYTYTYKLAEDFFYYTTIEKQCLGTVKVIGTVTNGNNIGVCVVAVPNGASYEPSVWRDITKQTYEEESQTYGEIIISDLNKEFNIPNESTLYLYFLNSKDLDQRVPEGFGLTGAFLITDDMIGSTVTVTDLKVTKIDQVSPVQYSPIELVSETLDLKADKEQLDQLTERVTQLENELNSANDTIASLLTKVEWLDQLDLEGLLASWSKTANT